MIKNDWLKNHPIAHRGLWSEVVPENSLLAFERALEKNYPIELDVQMLADGTFIVFHDWTLDRMTRKCGKLSTKNWSEIADLSLLDTQYTIVQLKDVLEMIDGQVPLLIEMKNRDHERSDYIEKLFNILENYNGDFILSSFDPFLIKAAKRIFDSVLCGQNFSDYKKNGRAFGWLQKNFMYFLWFISRHNPDFFVCEASLLPKCWIVSRAKKRHKLLLTWELKSKEDYEQKKDCIDNYIFDNELYE